MALIVLCDRCKCVPLRFRGGVPRTQKLKFPPENFKLRERNKIPSSKPGEGKTGFVCFVPCSNFALLILLSSIHSLLLLAPPLSLFFAYDMNNNKISVGNFILSCSHALYSRFKHDPMKLPCETNSGCSNAIYTFATAQPSHSSDVV